MPRHLQTAACAVALAISSPLWAQNSVFPSPHWGGTTYPDLTPTKRVGVHFIGFTQYGKERDAEGNYTFEPYNDIDETLGLNLLAASNTRLFNRQLLRSTLTYRGMVFAGVTDDHVTRYLQNEVAHKWLQRPDLPPVPRSTDDTYEPERISLGSSGTALAGYAGEVNLRMMSWVDSRTRGRLAVPTGFFAGAGFSASTIQQEVYGQFGAHPLKRWHVPGIPRCLLLDLQTVSVSAMSRAGVLLPGRVFDDIAGRYVTTQGTISLAFRLYLDYPVVVDYSVTGTSGMFVRGRTADERTKVRQDGRAIEDAYQSKEPLEERYYALKVRIGSFEFETYNDSTGGKDKGPSFGTRATLVVTSDYKALSGWIDRL